MSRGMRNWWCVLGVLAAACGSEVEPTKQTEEVQAPPVEAVQEKIVFRWTEEPAGERCTAGGTAIQSGVDVNANGSLDDEEVTQTSYTCHGTIHTEAVPGTQVLLNLAPEPVGTNCFYGGTAVRNGIDSNGNGILDPQETVQTQFVCATAPPYPTNWAASSPWPIESGLTTVGLWVPSGRKVTIFKASAASRLKVTVSDNFLTGYNVNGGYGYYEVRMNGGAMSPRCMQGQYSANTAGWGNVYSLQFSTVCLTDTLPAGLYEFETWVFAAVGQADVGGGAPQALVVVDEISPTANYGFSNGGGAFETASTAFQRVPGRTVPYTKQSQGTLLKVTLADTLRVGYLQNGGAGTLMIRLDGVDTNCFTGKYDAQGTGGDFHNPLVLTCILPNVTPGPHTFSVWVRADTGGAAYVGWDRSYPLLMVEEVVNQGLTYNNSSGGSGELGGDWAGVSGRWLFHTINAPGKTLRLTYSDTFRSAAGCNGYWGFFQLYVDNQPTGCINGQYAASGAGHDHHRPVNQVCLIKNLPPGPHVFSISSTTRQSPGGATCGSNYFGWNRGQPLLLLEELQ